MHAIKVKYDCMILSQPFLHVGTDLLTSQVVVVEQKEKTGMFSKIFGYIRCI